MRGLQPIDGDDRIAPARDSGGYESPIDEEAEEAEGIDGEDTVRESFDVYFGVSLGNLTGDGASRACIQQPANGLLRMLLIFCGA